MKKSKYLFIIMALMFLFCMCVTISYAEDASEFTYNVVDGNAVITGYTGSGGEVTVPSEIDSYSVVSIGERAFEGVDTITKITISDGIKRIEEMAFCRVGATEVVLPDSVTHIYDYAFSYCQSLKNIELSDNLEYMGNEVFIGAAALQKISLPDSLTEMGGGVFSLSGIKSISLPKGLSVIPGHTFYFTEIKEITIPATIKEIGYGAFDCCYKLKSVVFEGDIDKISPNAFSNCKKLESVNIPDSVTEIGERAFEECYALKLSKLPSKLEVIGDFAFMNCNLITEISFPDGVEKIADSAFSSCDALERIDLNNVVEIGEGAFSDGKKSRQVIFGTSMKKIKKRAFTYSMDEADNTVHVCYRGDESQWKKIKFSDSTISNYPVHFNYTEAHQLKKTTTKATLTATGNIANKCVKCGYKQVIEYISRPYDIKLSTTSYTYNKKIKTPKVTVLNLDMENLKKDTDYIVSYEKGRKLPGKYTVKITFKGKYSGVKRLYFTIKPRVTSKITASQTTTTVNLKWNKVTGADGYRVYKYNSKKKKYEKLKDVTKTTLKISDLKAGTVYKYKVRAYTKDDGTIWGSYSKVFETATKCKTPKITKLTTTKGKASLVWSNVSGESGYQVYYSTKKDSGYKKVKSYKANVVKGSKSKLKSGKKYYFKVRAYKKTDSGTVYSSWSKVKSIKIK